MSQRLRAKNDADARQSLDLVDTSGEDHAWNDQVHEPIDSQFHPVQSRQ